MFLIVEVHAYLFKTIIINVFDELRLEFEYLERLYFRSTQVA